MNCLISNSFNVNLLNLFCAVQRKAVIENNFVISVDIFRRLCKDGGCWMKILIKRPMVIGDYNSYMGSVGKSDWLLQCADQVSEVVEECQEDTFLAQDGCGCCQRLHPLSALPWSSPKPSSAEPSQLFPAPVPRGAREAAGWHRERWMCAHVQQCCQRIDHTLQVTSSVTTCQCTTLSTGGTVQSAGTH